MPPMLHLARQSVYDSHIKNVRNHPCICMTVCVYVISSQISTRTSWFSLCDLNGQLYYGTSFIDPVTDSLTLSRAHRVQNLWQSQTMNHYTTPSRSRICWQKHRYHLQATYIYIPLNSLQIASYQAKSHQACSQTELQVVYLVATPASLSDMS